MYLGSVWYLFWCETCEHRSISPSDLPFLITVLKIQFFSIKSKYHPIIYIFKNLVLFASASSKSNTIVLCGQVRGDPSEAREQGLRWVHLLADAPSAQDLAWNMPLQGIWWRSKRMSQCKPQSSCHVPLDIPTSFKGVKKLRMDDPNILDMYKTMQDKSPKPLRFPSLLLVLR